MTTLVVETPPSYLPERTYALRTVLGEFLGLEFKHSVGPNTGVVRISGDDGRCLEMPDVLFAADEVDWLTPRCLPREPLAHARLDGSGVRAPLVEPDLPVVFGTAPPLVERRDDASVLTLRLDVFGTAFFMLSRLEELVDGERDAHGRFPASASLACREGFVTRPLVDEYVGVMWACLQELWPRLERKRSTFSVFATHDVDTAFEYRGMSPTSLVRKAGSRVRAGDVRGAVRAPSQWLAVKRRGIAVDPWNTFDAAVDDAREAGWSSAFYLIPDTDPEGRDRGVRYSLDDPEIGGVIRRLADRGAEIGVHPSYRSHLDPGAVREQLEDLQAACRALGVDQQEWGGRAHYLRWEMAASPRLWAEAGLSYDSTLGFAESPGFRCGVCRPFPLYDHSAREELPLRERPLVVMDGSLTSAHYLGLAPDSADAHALVLELRERCRLVAGEYVILWHPYLLADPAHRALYRSALTGT